MPKVKQGSDEWLVARLGLITGSEVWKIISAEGTRQSYFNKLMDERKACRNRSQYSYVKKHKLRPGIRPLYHGKESESKAIHVYEALTGNNVLSSPELMIHSLYKYIGASLDGLVDHPRATVEVKCPVSKDEFLSAKVYGVPDKHMPQVQLGLEVSNRDVNHFVYFYNFSGRMDIHIQEIERDQEYIDMLMRECIKFNKYLNYGYLEPRYDLRDGVPKVVT